METNESTFDKEHYKEKGTCILFLCYAFLAVLFVEMVYTARVQYILDKEKHSLIFRARVQKVLNMEKREHDKITVLAIVYQNDCNISNIIDPEEKLKKAIKEQGLSAEEIEILEVRIEKRSEIRNFQARNRSEPPYSYRFPLPDLSDLKEE